MTVLSTIGFSICYNVHSLELKGIPQKEWSQFLKRRASCKSQSAFLLPHFIAWINPEKPGKTLTASAGYAQARKKETLFPLFPTQVWLSLGTDTPRDKSWLAPDLLSTTWIARLTSILSTTHIKPRIVPTLCLGSCSACSLAPEHQGPLEGFRHCGCPRLIVLLTDLTKVNLITRFIASIFFYLMKDFSPVQFPILLRYQRTLSG